MLMTFIAHPLKSIAFLFLCAIISVSHAQAPHPQSGSNFRISYNALASGKFTNAEKLTAVYVINFWGKRSGTRLALRENVLKPDTSRIRRVALTKDGNIWSAEIPIPLNAAVLSYYITDGATIDMNGDKTFVDYVYLNDRPVQNAHFFMTPFLKMADASLIEQIEEARKETVEYPQNFRAYYQYYQLRLDWKNNSVGMQAAIAAEIDSLLSKHGKDIDLLNLAARTYYSLFKNTIKGLEFRNMIPPEKQYPDVAKMYDREGYEALKKKTERETADVQAKLIGKPAAMFALDFFPSGIAYLEHTKGKVVVLYFWALGCKPCMSELDQLKNLYEEFRTKDFELFAVNIDPKREDVLPLLREKKYPFPIIFADTKIIQDYGVKGISQTIVIDKQGLIQKIFGIFPGSSLELLRSALNALLQES